MHPNHTNMRILILTVFIISLCSCEPTAKRFNNSKLSNHQDTIIKNEVYSFETYEVRDENWGYKIFKQSQLIINQPHIPSIQGNKGFNNQQEAEIAAQFIIEKLKKKIFPPTFSTKELDSLGLL